MNYSENRLKEIHLKINKDSRWVEGPRTFLYLTSGIHTSYELILLLVIIIEHDEVTLIYM